MKNMTVLTRVGNQGQEVYAFQFESDAPVKKESGRRRTLQREEKMVCYRKLTINN